MSCVPSGNQIKKSKIGRQQSVGYYIKNKQTNNQVSDKFLNAEAPSSLFSSPTINIS